MVGFGGSVDARATRTTSASRPDRVARRRGRGRRGRLSPSQSAFPDAPRDVPRRVRISRLERVRHERPVAMRAVVARAEPPSDLGRDRSRIAVGSVCSEIARDDVVDVAPLLSGQKAREQDGQTERRRLGDGARTGLGDERVGGDHVLGHVGHEAEGKHDDGGG